MRVLPLTLIATILLLFNPVCLQAEDVLDMSLDQLIPDKKEDVYNKKTKKIEKKEEEPKKKKKKPEDEEDKEDVGKEEEDKTLGKKADETVDKSDVSKSEDGMTPQQTPPEHQFLSKEQQKEFNQEWNRISQSLDRQAAQADPQHPLNKYDSIYNPINSENYANLSPERAREIINKDTIGTKYEGTDLGGKFVRAAQRAAEVTGTYVDPLTTYSIAKLEAGKDLGSPSGAYNFSGIKQIGQSTQNSLPPEIASTLNNAGSRTLSTYEYVNGSKIKTSAKFQGFNSLEDSLVYKNYFLTTHPSFQKYSLPKNQLPSGYATDPRWKSMVTSIYNRTTRNN